LQKIYWIVFRHNAKKRNINLSLITKEPAVMVWFDVNLLDKVFFNLISNALKFTNENGRIQLIFSRSEDTIEIAVQDNGIGMEPNEAEHVFEQFYQADNGMAKGSGWGWRWLNKLLPCILAP
jgi:signal transduction histidine kinase